MKGKLKVPLIIPKLKKRGPYERVAFFGPMVSGKSFLSQHLVNTKNYKRVALADKLKAIVYDLYGLSGKDGNVRTILQEFADDVKKWDDDVFIKHFLIKVLAIESADPYYPPRIVCDDLRFVREADVLRKAGFTIIKVECSEELRKERMARLYPTTDPSVHAHRSEQQTSLIVYDHKVKSETVTDLLDLERLLE